jgi:hypothetical protein
MYWGFAMGLLLMVGIVVSQEPSEPAVVENVTYGAVNPSTLNVVWKVIGEPGDTVNCHVSATDPSGTYDGSDSVEAEVSHLGARTAGVPLTIDNEGAAYVTEVEVEC